MTFLKNIKDIIIISELFLGGRDSALISRNYGNRPESTEISTQHVYIYYGSILYTSKLGVALNEIREYKWHIHLTKVCLKFAE